MQVAWSGQIWPSIGGLSPTTLPVAQCLPGRAEAGEAHPATTCPMMDWVESFLKSNS
jgi:hypothetical protein